MLVALRIRLCRCSRMLTDPGSTLDVGRIPIGLMRESLGGGGLYCLLGACAELCAACELAAPAVKLLVIAGLMFCAAPATVFLLVRRELEGVIILAFIRSSSACLLYALVHALLTADWLANGYTKARGIIWQAVSVHMVPATSHACSVCRS